MIKRARVWGCPVWVLDPKLADGKSLPKWTKKSHLGMYLGTSAYHSTNVGKILNLRTGSITPQYHVVYDETFTSVQGKITDDLFDEKIWTRLITLGGLDQTLDPEDIRGDKVPFQEFYDDFVVDDIYMLFYI